jgi:hypothetical protein
MATDTLQRGSPEPNPARGARGGRVIEYQQYIDSELGKTRRRVKWIDLWTSMAVLAAGFIAYLLVAAVIDHLLPGGLGTFGRWLLLIGLLVGVAAHLVAVFVPFLLRKVNPVYAAAAIEHSGGTMKNTLINFLLLRKETALPDGVIDAMKEQAAVRLHNVSSDASIDRTSLLRWCYVLAAVMVGSLIYAVVAPKDSFRSIHRVLSPWSDLAAPTRVRIEVIEPGNTDRRRDDVVNVTLRAAGLRAGDAVTLFYSATGNPADDVPLPMQGDEAHYHWKTVLPPGSEGLKQDLFYYIQAGDTQSPRYRIRVIATPVINVRTVTFDYPAYTGLPPRTVERQGDLKALEGTRITLTAEANQPIKSAHAAFDKARTKDVELRADGLTAVGGFDLALLKDRLTPAHTSYLIRFANIDGEENPKPTEYKIEVTPDQSPEVRVVEPNTPVEKELSLPLGGLLRVTAAARDPDFQLAELTVVLRKAGSLLREERLLSEPRYGEFSNTLVLSPERYNLRVGEKFTFRVRAADNKSPNPNVVETKDYTVVVTPPTGQPQPHDPRRDPQQNPNQPNRDPNQPQPPQPNGQNGGKPNNEGAPQPGNPPPNDARGQPNDPQNANQQPGNNGQPQPPGGNDSGKPNAGDGGRPQSGDSPQNGEPQQGRESEQGRDQQPPKNPSDNSPANGEQKSGTDRKQPEQPIDPSVDPGKAFEELQKHFEQKDKQNNPGQSGDQTQPKPPEAGEQNRQPQPRGEQPQNGEQKSGDQKSGEQKSGEQKSGEQKSGSQPAGSQQNGGSQPNNSQPSGSQQNPEQKSGGGQPGENQSGAGQSGGSQPQKSPDGGAAGDQRQAGGKDGTGRSQSDAPAGNQQGTGGAQNQPSQKADDPNAKPGGENGAKTTDQKPSGGDAERRPGENVGGAEEKRPAEGSPTGDAKPEQRPGDSPSGKPQGNSQERNAQGSGEQPGTAPDPRSGNQPQPGQNETGKPNDSSNAGQPRPNGTPNAGQPGVNRESTPANSGQGTQSGGDPSKPDAKSPRAGEKPTEPQPGSKPSVNEKNPQGSQSENAGREGKAPADGGSPKQEEVAKPRNYQKGQDAASNDQEGNKEEGKTPSHSKSESDAQGSTSGDRSAKNGEEGGGQRSQQSGTGAAGQSQAGEQGGGVSGQEGDAATSNQGGSKVRSGDPSQGKPGEQKGPGSQSQNPGEQPGGSQSSQSGQSHSGNDGRPSDDRQQNNSSNDKSGAQNPSGGGNVNPNGNSGSDDQPPPSRNTAAPPADPANLDYAQKVTDLTLERLKQQLDKGQVDPELLERFKSREALEEFARRWEAMRQSAKQPGPSGDAARKQFQENLKSLGLQPRTTQQQGSAAAGDEFRDVRGRARSEPPAKYADQYRAYQTGVGQAEK